MSYRYESVEYGKNEKGIRYDVDAIYLLHREGNSNVNTIITSFERLKAQLLERPVAQHVHILHHSAAESQVHWYLTVFRDAKAREYDRILVMEENCLMNLDVPDTAVENVNRFLNERKKERFVYRLGSLPLFMVLSAHESYSTGALGSCANIYSKSFREHALDHAGSIGSWDVFLFMNSQGYTYASPLCFPTYATNGHPLDASLDGAISCVQRIVDLATLQRHYSFIYSAFYAMARNSLSFLAIIFFAFFLLYVKYQKICDFLSTKTICGRSVAPLLEKITKVKNSLDKKILRFPWGLPLDFARASAVKTPATVSGAQRDVSV